MQPHGVNLGGCLCEASGNLKHESQCLESMCPVLCNGRIIRGIAECRTSNCQPVGNHHSVGPSAVQFTATAVVNRSFKYGFYWRLKFQKFRFRGKDKSGRSRPSVTEESIRSESSQSVNFLCQRARDEEAALTSVYSNCHGLESK